MIRKFCRALTLFAFLFMYVTLEVMLFTELEWQGGLAASLFFTTFALASLAGLMYRPPFVGLDQGVDEEANCRP